MHIQISDDRGFMNENTPGSSFIGFYLTKITINYNQEASTHKSAKPHADMFCDS